MPNISNDNCHRLIVPILWSRKLSEHALCPELLIVQFCSFHRTIIISCLQVDFECFIISSMANLETEVYELLIKAFLLIQAINMTKRLLFNSPSWSRLTILPLVSQFLNFSHNRTPNPIAFREMSFWNEMFLCWIKTEMFTVAESYLILLM